MIRKLILLLSLITIGFNSFSQDTLTLISGKVITAKVDEVDTLSGRLLYSIHKKGELVPKEIQTYEVFSITNSKGEENILYRKDTLIGNIFTQYEMRKFIIGEQEAMSGYNTAGIFISSFSVSLGISLLDTYKFKTNDSIPYGFFHSEPSVLQIATPLVVTLIAGLPKITIDVGNVQHKEHIDDKYFAWGYGKVGRSKRVFASLKGSVIGMATGLISYYVFKP